jgi:flagellar assembly factor FliW
MMMTGTQSPMAASFPLPSEGESEIIDTRFGKIALKRDNPVVFPHGLLGMPDKINYFLTEFPSEKLKQFKMLQSLDDHTLSFITLPLDVENTIIAKDDVHTACKDLGIEPKDTAILLIVSVHRSPTSVTLSVNARAPLMIDAKRRLAAQYVFPNDRYKVQHFISA